MRRKNARTVVALLLVGAVWSCGDDDSSNQGNTLSNVSSTDGVLGTIHANLDGVARTWYVVEGDVGGEPYASGMFIPVDGGTMVSLGGFDTAEPPMESFRVDVAGGGISLGDYEGSAFSLMITVPEGQTSARAGLGDGMAGDGTLAYQPRASMEDVMAGTLFSQSGSIEVADARFGDMKGTLTGTFSGEIARMDGSESITVTDGRFEVELPRR